jgi:hypothetical protein
MDRSRLYGFLICIGIVILATLFLVGLFHQSYWALAIPVAAFTLGLLGLCFWIGWTIVMLKTEAPPDDK